MNGKTHKIGGLCAGALASTVLLQEPFTFDKIILTGALVGGSFVGSLMPDIDHQGSTIGHTVKPISSAIGYTFGHRGITHAPLTHLLGLIALLFLGEFFKDFPKLLYISFIMGLFVGGISHILLDSLTVSGIPLFYPFDKKKYRLAKLTTGKHDELVQVASIIITVVLIFFIL